MALTASTPVDVGTAASRMPASHPASTPKPRRCTVTATLISLAGCAVGGYLGVWGWNYVLLRRRSR